MAAGAVMQTPSPWATKADVEAAREALKADIAALHADLRAVKALLTDQQTRRSWWRRLFTAGAVVVAVMAVSTAGARAGFLDGNKLYAQCMSSQGWGRAMCAGYVAATADIMQRQPDKPLSGRGPEQCPADNVTLDQMIDVVKQALTAHPERRHYAAASLVIAALAEAFPCQ